jgi:hypothetical protein
MGCHKMARDGMGWHGMAWDGMGWNGVGWHGVDGVRRHGRHGMGWHGVINKFTNYTRLSSSFTLVLIVSHACQQKLTFVSDEVRFC